MKKEISLEDSLLECLLTGYSQIWVTRVTWDTGVFYTDYILIGFHYVTSASHTRFGLNKI